MIVDLYTHLFPQPFFARLTRTAKGLGSLAARMQAVPAVLDLEARLRTMDGLGDYRQVLTLPHPALEEVAGPAEAAELARLANDGLAEICARHPGRFPAFAASVSLLDVDAALAEIDRAVTQLGARGVQIHSNVAGRPLDLPAYAPVFAAMAAHDLPVWLHPSRGAAIPDYLSEPKSRYEMWWCFGWPYETSVAMARLVFSGVFDRHPGLKIITHHLGGMIPFFDGRVGPGMDVLGSRTADEDYSGVLPALKRPHLEYFRQFYADTAMFGGTAGLPSGLRFFGADHVVFASDAPFGPIAESLRALDSVDLTPDERRKILSGNAGRLLRMDFG